MRLLNFLIFLFATGITLIAAAPVANSSLGTQCGTFSVDNNRRMHILQVTGKTGCLELLPDGPPINGMSKLRYWIEKGHTCATY